MKAEELEALRYPIGKFRPPVKIEAKVIDDWIDALERFPDRLEKMVSRLDERQLETRYRPDGWTVRQLIHHISDSHHNSYIRFKWALTEDKPVIKVYDEKRWALLHDSLSAPIDQSLIHLKAIHRKLVYLLRGLNADQLKRKFIHPEGQVEISLAENIGRNVWHGDHHYTHIANLIQREQW